MILFISTIFSITRYIKFSIKIFKTGPGQGRGPGRKKAGGLEGRRAGRPEGRTAGGPEGREAGGPEGLRARRPEGQKV